MIFKLLLTHVIPYYNTKTILQYQLQAIVTLLGTT